MECASNPAGCSTATRIKTLEESACFLVDLANGLQQDSEWLWNIVDKLTHEAAMLEDHLIHRPSMLPDST